MLITCAALALVGGCGSSSHSTGSSSSSASRPPRAATGRLKVNTTPKFASPPASAAVQSGVVKVAYRNITVEHNVTSQSGPDRFASKNFGEGHSFRATLTKPGTIHYLCTIHPTSMNGTIVVVD